MSSEDFQVNEYQLTILTVKMKVKFPCKMKLQHSSNPITQEVQSNDQSKFIFNQQVTIQEELQKSSFDLNVNLITQKGAKYVSGVLKLGHAELQKSEGQKITCQLTKCLDNEAFCQIKVNKVKSGRVPKRVSVSSTLLEIKRLNSNNEKNTYNTEEKLHLQPKSKINMRVETRSEFGLNQINTRKNHQWEDTRSKGAAQTLIYKSNFLKSPKSKKTVAMCSPKSKLGLDFNQEYEILSQREKLSSQSQVYKQGYQKLKQKFKRQSESLKSEQTKRIQLEANQNNFKIEIMRLKLKTQEQQRIITQKNQKINQLQVFISEINKQELDMGYLKEENRNLESKVQMMGDVINGLKKENQGVKRLRQQQTKTEKLIVNELRLQIQASKQKLQRFSIQSSQSLKSKTQQIISLSSELKSKNSFVELQKSQINKLQAHVQNKIYDFQRTLQQQKNQSTQACNQLKQKIELMERQNKKIQKELVELKNYQQKMKALILKAEYDKKVLLEQQKVIKNQLLQYKTLRQKHSQLARQLNFLQQDKSHLQKQLQTLSQSKQINLQQINEQFEIKLSYYKKQTREFEQKHKSLSISKIELQSQMQVARNSIDKQKRQIESLNGQMTDHKNSIKQLKQYSNLLEQQNLTLQNQISLTNNKLRFGEQTSKMQIEKYRSQLQRTKIQLGSQNAKAIQLFQAKSSLQIQLNKNKIQIQYHEDKIDKLFATNKQLQHNIEYVTKEHQSQISDLQQAIAKNQTQLKTSNQSLHKAELQRIALDQKIQTLKKDHKISEEKMSHLEAQLKFRHQDITLLEQKLRNQQKTSTNVQSDYSALKNEFLVLKNDKTKLEKILEIKNQDIQTLKKDFKSLNEQKERLYNVETQLREQLKRNNQTFTKLQMRLKFTDREYTKFKDLMHKTIQSEYAKLPLLGNVNSLQNKKITSPSKGNEQSKITQNGQNRQSTEHLIIQTLNTATILSNFTYSITESKNTLFKLIQHNKQLKKQIQSMKEQSEQSSNKYQFTEIQLHRDIQQLEEQLNQVYEQKQEQIVNTDKYVLQLNAKIHQKQNLCDQLQQQIEELEYALSSLKMDFQTDNAKNDKKVLILKSTIQQLQQKMDFFKISLTNQEDVNHQLEEKVENLKNQRDDLLQTTTKNKSAISELIRQRQISQSNLSQAIRDKKCLQERYNEIEIQFSQEKDLKLKTQQFLQNEEKKNLELKQFASTLMKQKQNIIKSQLEKGDKILELETQQIQLRRDFQITAEDLHRVKSQLQQIKQKLRKQLVSSKNLEGELSQSVLKQKKFSQKVEQKQKQIQMKDQIISRLDMKYRQLTEKNYKETLELHSQIDSKYTENISISKELNQKILLLEAKIQQMQHNKAKSHHENVLLNDQLLAQKQNTELMRRQIAKLEAQLEQISDQYKSLQKRNEHLTLQIQQRQEQLSSLNDKIIVLQGELQATTKDKSIKIQELNNDWIRKYEHLLQEDEQKFSILQNERQMIRSQLEQKINELQLSLNQTKNSEIGITDIRKNFQQKIKKIQSDRLTTILTKNNQIKKLTEENKILIHKVNQLELNQKQNSELLENIRKRLINEEKIRKQSDEKVKSHKKMHDAEITSLLAKQAKYKGEKGQIYQSIWSNQREVRKVVQNYIKKVLDQCDNVHIDKITTSSKGLQADVVKAMTSRLSSQ